MDDGATANRDKKKQISSGKWRRLRKCQAKMQLSQEREKVTYHNKFGKGHCRQPGDMFRVQSSIRSIKGGHNRQQGIMMNLQL